MNLQKRVFSKKSKLNREIFSSYLVYFGSHMKKSSWTHDSGSFVQNKTFVVSVNWKHWQSLPIILNSSKFVVNDSTRIHLWYIHILSRWTRRLNEQLFRFRFMLLILSSINGIICYDKKYIWYWYTLPCVPFQINGFCPFNGEKWRKIETHHIQLYQRYQ